MLFYYFHRKEKLPIAPFKDPREDNHITPQRDASGKLLKKTQSIRYKSVSHDNESITIEVDFEYNPLLGSKPIKGTIRVQPWEIYSIELQGTYSVNPRMVFRSRSSVAECAFRGDGHDMMTYLGCVLFTDEEAMLYLRLHPQGVSNFEEVVLGNDESSAGAFSRISPKADTLIRIFKEKRKAMESIDFVSAISVLTTQVDFLTQLVTQAGLVDEPKVASDLTKATNANFLLNCEALAEEKNKLHQILLNFSKAKKDLLAPRVNPYAEVKSLT